MKQTDVFLSGGTGLIGRWLVVELTRMGQTVTVLMRRAAKRAAAYQQWVTEHSGDGQKLLLLDGDLTQPQLGLAETDLAVARSAANFYHLGAIQGFGLPAETAEQINVAGTKSMLALAASAPRLNRFVLVSGFRLRTYLEQGVSPDEITGSYEASKMRADLWVRQTAQAQQLPVTYVHPAVVLGDSRTGETTQFGINFFATLQDLRQGKLPVIPGSPQHWLPMVPVDYLAAFLARIPELSWSAGEDFTILDQQTPPLGPLLKQAAALMGVKAPSRYLPLPLLTLLLRAGLDKITGQDPEAMAFIDTVAYDTTSAEKAATEMGLKMPDFAEMLQANVGFQLATHFGKLPYRSGAGLRAVGNTLTFGWGNWDSPRLVLLHGLPLDADSWQDVSAALPEGSTLAVDLPGNGRSPTPIPPNPAAWLADLLHDSPHPVWLAGHSLGTAYALRYAAAYPDRVGGLLLISPFFLQGKPPALLRNGTSGRLLLSLVNRKRYETIVTGRSAPLTPLLESGFKALRRPPVRRRVADTLAAVSRAPLRTELTGLLNKVKVPVHLVVGEMDPLQTDIDRLPVTTIPGAGHNPHVTHPQQIADLLRQLISL